MRVLLLPILMLCAACSYVQYDDTPGHNVLIRADNRTGMQLQYEVISWDSDRRGLWIDKEGRIRLAQLPAGGVTETSMRVLDGHIRIHTDTGLYSLPVADDNSVVITPTDLAPTADG